MNGHSTIDTNEATEHLKSILNVGKTESAEEEEVKSTTKMESSTADSSFVNTIIGQQIELSGQEENVSIYGTDVSIYSSPLIRGSNSGKMLIDNIADYGWEQKYYLGCLVCVHISKNYLAYTVKAAPSPYGFVRVIKHSPHSHLLLRGFCGGAKDISFAHSMSRILFGCVDEIGELYIYEIFDSDQGLTQELRLHIKRPMDTTRSIYHRLVWCPYVPEDGNENPDLGQDDITMMSSLLMVTHDEKAEIWNMDMVLKEYGGGEIDVGKVKIGLQTIAEHKKPITAAAFSPDAIALATSSLDGEVKFFQVSIQENDASPKCLHEWIPHYGKPLSSLFFLDNHKNYNSDSKFWKFALTGAENNQEIKVWSCKTWQCLQTIRILPYEDDSVAPCLKAAIDISASYLVLSDISRKVLYIMKIRQEENAMITSVCEYVVTFPVLSFSIADIYPYRDKMPLNNKNSDDEDDEDDDDGKDDYDDNDSTEMKMPTYVLKLFWINIKSCQQCRIFFHPKIDSPARSMGSISSSQDSFVYKDGLSDLSGDVQEQMNDHDLICQPITKGDSVVSPNKAVNTSIPSASITSPGDHLSPNYQECKDVLLTPKDFTDLHSDINTFNLDGVAKESQSIVQQDEMSALDTERSPRPRRKSSQHSCASSPSREVAEILSPGQLLVDRSTPPKSDVELPCPVTDNLQERSPLISLRPSDYSTNEWPEAPDPNKEYKMTSRVKSELHLPCVPLEQSPIRHGHQMTEGEGPSELMHAVSKSTLQKLERSVDGLSLQMIKMMEVIQHQNQVIQMVKNEIQGLKQHQQFMRTSFESIDNAVSVKVGHVVAENITSEFDRLEKFFQKKDADDMHQYENQLITMSQSVANNIGSHLDKVVKQEMKNTVIPHTTKFLDSAIRQLQTQLLQKLSSTDNTIKETLSNHLKCKVFNENLAITAVDLLRPSLQATCQDIFQNSLMPGLNSFFQALFAQVNDDFSKGTAELVEKSEKGIQHLTNNMGTTMKSYEEQMNKIAMNADIISKKLNSLPREKSISENDKLIHMIKEAVHDVLSNSKDPAIVRSHPPTPVPQAQNQVKVTRQDILHLIKQGDVNAAFQKALSALDMDFVFFVCETVSIEQVFEPEPCPLHQSVLLSLINQLSSDFGEKTDIKVRYIEEAIASLDINNIIVKQHSKKVCTNLNERLKIFLEANPKTKYRRNCRRIILALETFLK